MSEHFEDVVKYVMSDDESDLSRVRAERDYALHALEREIAIAQSEQAKSAMLVKALEDISTATLNGSICDDVAWFSPIETLHDFCERILSDVGGEK